MLSFMKENNYKIGLISNCSKEEITGLQNSVLYQYLDAVVLSCNVGLVKPDRKTYEYCLNILNEPASNCFFVGDGGSDELNGAKNVGMIPIKALWFIKHYVNELDIDKTFPSFLEPFELLEYIKDYEIK